MRPDRISSWAPSGYSLGGNKSLSVLKTHY